MSWVYDQADTYHLRGTRPHTDRSLPLAPKSSVDPYYGTVEMALLLDKESESPNLSVLFSSNSGDSGRSVRIQVADCERTFMDLDFAKFVEFDGAVADPSAERLAEEDSMVNPFLICQPASSVGHAASTDACSPLLLGESLVYEEADPAAGYQCLYPLSVVHLDHSVSQMDTRCSVDASPDASDLVVHAMCKYTLILPESIYLWSHAGDWIFLCTSRELL